jgi:hypothetical protein
MPERTLKGTSPVFLISEHYGPDNLQDAQSAIDACTFAAWCRPPGGTLNVPAGWTYVGEAEVTLHLVDDNVLVANKVGALEAEATQLQAETEQRLIEIRRKINTLLAIEHQPSGVVS